MSSWLLALPTSSQVPFELLALVGYIPGLRCYSESKEIEISISFFLKSKGIGDQPAASGDIFRWGYFPGGGGGKRWPPKKGQGKIKKKSANSNQP